MSFEDLLTRGFAWLALAGYGVATAVRLNLLGRWPAAAGARSKRAEESPVPESERSRWRVARGAWTVGCAMYLAHVLCAYHFVHHWSHAAALEFTARRTEETIGWSWGGGLYVNHLLMLVWVVDAFLWWKNGPTWPLRRSRWSDWSVQFFLAFMWINATIVFGAGPIRWVGCAIAAALALVWLASWRRRPQTAAPRDC